MTLHIPPPPRFPCEPPHAVGKAVDNFVEFLHEQGEKIVADKPDGLLARVLSAGSSNKRRLMTLSGVADRFGERMQVWGRGLRT